MYNHCCDFSVSKCCRSVPTTKCLVAWWSQCNQRSSWCAWCEVWKCDVCDGDTHLHITVMALLPLLRWLLFTSSSISSRVDDEVGQLCSGQHTHCSWVTMLTALCACNHSNDNKSLQECDWNHWNAQNAVSTGVKYTNTYSVLTITNTPYMYTHNVL